MTSRSWLRMGCVLLHAVLFNGCTYGATQHTPDEWAFAVTEPELLFQYKYAEKSPAYCKQPDALIGELHKAAAADQSCAVSLKSDGGTGRLLEMECVIPEESPACSLRYHGLLWAERDPASMTDYALRGIGWVVSPCRKGALYPVESQSLFDLKRREGAVIRELVAPCENRSVA